MTTHRIKHLLETMKISTEEAIWVTELITGEDRDFPGLADLKNAARELARSIETALSKFEEP